MAKKNADTNYNTNLASEYLMMSLHCRAGKEAYLSLGNKTGVDILVKARNGAICVVEVKGVNKRDDWFVGSNGKAPAEPNLFFALICFNSNIPELSSAADFWIIPSAKLAEPAEQKIEMV